MISNFQLLALEGAKLPLNARTPLLTLFVSDTGLVLPFCIQASSIFLHLTGHDILTAHKF